MLVWRSAENETLLQSVSESILLFFIQYLKIQCRGYEHILNWTVDS